MKKEIAEDGPNMLNAQQASSHHGLRTTASHHHHHHHHDEDSEDEIEDSIEEPISEHHQHHDRTFREERSNIQSDLHPEEIDVGIN